MFWCGTRLQNQGFGARRAPQGALLPAFGVVRRVSVHGRRISLHVVRIDVANEMRRSPWRGAGYQRWRQERRVLQEVLPHDVRRRASLPSNLPSWPPTRSTPGEFAFESSPPSRSWSLDDSDVGAERAVNLPGCCQAVPIERQTGANSPPRTSKVGPRGPRTGPPPLYTAPVPRRVRAAFAVVVVTVSEFGFGMGSCNEWQRLRGEDGANIGAPVDSSGGGEVRLERFLLNARPKNAIATIAELALATSDFLSWRSAPLCRQLDQVRRQTPED